MSKIPVDKFISQLKLAQKTSTVYAFGGWGASANFSANKTKYANRTEFNATDIKNAPSNAFYFDCVCLVKGILWGWNADTSKKYGGATYASNGIPDYSIANIKKRLTTHSTNFNKIERGEFLYIGDDHCGIYIGDGYAIECTPIWEDGVQKTYVSNMGTGPSNYHKRRWDGHGKLPWIEYEEPKHTVLEEDGRWGKNTTYYLQKMLGTKADGIISSQPTSNKKYLIACSTASWEFKSNATGSSVIKALQKMVGAKVDGKCGKETITKLQTFLKAEGFYTGTIDGYMGEMTVIALQKFINQYFQEQAIYT